MNTVLENAIIRNLDTRTQGNESVEQRLVNVRRRFNPSKFYVLGFINRSSQVVLKPRFYNIRNEFGRWAKVR